MSRRLLRLCVFLLPCVAAAAVVALVAGAIESSGALDHRLISVGFSATFTWPVLTVAAVIGRLAWAAWARLFARALAMPDGHLRFAGWFFTGLGLVGALAFLGFETVRWFAQHTAFKARVVGVAVPAVLAVILAGLLVLAPIVADALAAALGWLELRVARRLARRRRISAEGLRVFMPGRVVLVVLALGVALLVLEWFVTLKPTFGYVDLSVLVQPAVAAVALPLALVALLRLPRLPRLVATWLALAAAAGSIGFALRARYAEPLAVLEVWAEPSIASDMIDELYSLEDIRHDIEFVVAKPQLAPGAAPRDVLLITIDTVRADHVSAYGGSAAMPNFDELAKRGAAFARAYAPSNVTRRSIPSLATGVAPERVRGKVAGWALRLDPRHILLAERFRAAGYRTAGFFCCESFWAPRHHLGLDRGLDHADLDYDGAVLAEHFATWAKAQGPLQGRPPWFVWIHFIEPHNWTQDTEVKAADRNVRYDASLSKVDGFLGTVLGALATRGDGGPIIAVTADHGEALGEHGQPYHSTDVYNSQIQVPLVIAGPGISAREIHEPVGTLGLPATLLALGGWVPPGLPEMDGADFSALAIGTKVPNPDGGYAISSMIADRSVPAGARALVVGRYKLIEKGDRYELYDVVTDPHEQHNLAVSQRGKLVELQRTLRERDAIDRQSPFTVMK